MQCIIRGGKIVPKAVASAKLDCQLECAVPLIAAWPTSWPLCSERCMRLKMYGKVNRANSHTAPTLIHACTAYLPTRRIGVIVFDLMLLFAGHATLADQREVMRIIGLRTKTGSLARMNLTATYQVFCLLLQVPEPCSQWLPNHALRPPVVHLAAKVNQVGRARTEQCSLRSCPDAQAKKILFADSLIAALITHFGTSPKLWQLTTHCFAVRCEWVVIFQG